MFFWLVAIFLVIFTFFYPIYNTSAPVQIWRLGVEEEMDIATIESIEVNKSKQWIFVRGQDLERPLLLFLHGGPGSTSTAHIRKFLPELEQRFVVIHWDQRGAGKSFTAGRNRKHFTTEQMINDVGELTRLMLQRFGRDKIYLMGASWGTYLGVEAISRWPEYYYAYLGAGQIVNQEEGEQISYDFLVKHAEARNDQKALDLLRHIGRPPFLKGKHVKYLMKQRDLLMKYGGSFRNKEVQQQFADASIIRRQSEYNWIDKINWVRGQYRSERILGPVFRKTDFRTSARQLHVPIFIVQGQYDMQTPTELVSEYFELLQAPVKRLFLFEESGHIPMVEEKEKFLQVLDSMVSETFEQGHASST